MDNKVEFGCDFLYVMRELQMRSGAGGNLDPVSDAAARLLLVQWGLSIEEGDKANELFWQRVNEGTLDPLAVAAQRIADGIGGDRGAQKRLIVQLAAVGCMDFDLTDREVSLIGWFRDAFDMRSSEFADLCRQGLDLAVALDYFGTKYAESAAK